MKRTFTAACAALVGLLALSQSAVAQQKTSKQCNEEWRADRAAIQASGKTKRVFVAECRGVPVAARVAAAVPAGKDQFATEAEAKMNCRADTVVWVNSTSRVYHGSGSRSWQDQDGCVYVREGIGRCGLPRCQDCKRRGNLISRTGDTGLMSWRCLRGHRRFFWARATRA